ncbi:MAG: hypothetical protein FWF11_03865, partial [Coriobacteriia bacterium]|nr:hypothetical protein [Coriobacteriia bacterium]
MTARISNPIEGLSRKSKCALLLAAIVLLAIPFLAAANSSAVQSVINPVVTQVQNMSVPAADDSFVPNEAPAVATSGFSTFSSSGIRTEAKLFSAGSAHSLGIKPDGTLWGWGENQFGATGLGIDTGEELLPVQIGTATNWTAVSAGWDHSLALRSDGTLWSWGDNQVAATGLGTTVGTQLTPAQIGTATDWTQISAGTQYSLAIKSDGTLWSWGSHATGKTGLGAVTGNQGTPAQIGTDADWATVSAGNGHSLAIKADGTLWAWGDNWFNQLGFFPATVPQPTPTQVGTDTNWTQVSAGNDCSLAIRSDGTLWAWGNSQNGRTGLGTAWGNQVIPEQVGTDTDWAAVSAGASHTLAIKADATLWAWGSNWGGQAGQDISVDDQLTPAQVGSDNNWLFVAAANGWHSLAMRTNDSLWGWGYNEYGQVGVGDTDDRFSPYLIWPLA